MIYRERISWPPNQYRFVPIFAHLSNDPLSARSLHFLSFREFGRALSEIVSRAMKNVSGWEIKHPMGERANSRRSASIRRRSDKAAASFEDDEQDISRVRRLWKVTPMLAVSANRDLLILDRISVFLEIVRLLWSKMFQFTLILGQMEKQRGKRSMTTCFCDISAQWRLRRIGIDMIGKRNIGTVIAPVIRDKIVVLLCRCNETNNLIDAALIKAFPYGNDSLLGTKKSPTNHSPRIDISPVFSSNFSLIRYQRRIHPAIRSAVKVSRVCLLRKSYFPESGASRESPITTGVDLRSPTLALVPSIFAVQKEAPSIYRSVIVGFRLGASADWTSRLCALLRPPNRRITAKPLK